MTSKQKVGLGLAIIGFFVRLPLLYAGTVLLYLHVQAPTILWVLLVIGLPVALVLEVGTKLMESMADDSKPADRGRGI